MFSCLSNTEDESRAQEFAASFDALTYSSQVLSHKELRDVAIDSLSHAACRQFIACSVWTYSRTRWVREINTAVLRAGCEAYGDSRAAASSLASRDSSSNGLKVPMSQDTTPRRLPEFY